MNHDGLPEGCHFPSPDPAERNRQQTIVSIAEEWMRQG